MNKEIEPDKYGKLSITSLVTGILAVSPALLYCFLWMPITNFLRNATDVSVIPYIILPLISIDIGLAIAAVVCGSIDLRKIKVGLHNKKDKGFDIIGIIMGGVVILFAIIFALGEIIIPH